MNTYTKEEINQKKERVKKELQKEDYKSKQFKNE